MEQIYWNKLRVLVTNKCNYRCPFCHNEGQGKDASTQTMDFNGFKNLFNALKGQKLSEINFSGGEPFIHPQIVDMIKYANDNFDCDISCATNLSLIKQTQIDELSLTRVKFNIQFPYADSDMFSKSTGKGCMSKIVSNIHAVKNAGIQIGLNTVIQSSDSQYIEQMILFSLENELPLKLLPQIGGLDSEKYKDIVYPVLKKYAVDYHDKKNGAIRWSVEKDGNRISVLYINSPCFTNDIVTCRNYGEIRIHPDFSLQTCILKDNIVSINPYADQSIIINQFATLWNNFKTC